MELNGFISFHHGDHRAKLLAEKLDKSLESRGFSVWRWGKSQRPGNRTREEISNAIDASHFFVPIISNDYGERHACMEELELAMQVQGTRKLSHFNAPFIFPVKLSEAKIPRELQGLGLTYAELSDDYDTTNLESIVESVCNPQNYVPALAFQHKYSFNNLPSPFVLKDGGVDALIVLGHSEKKSGKQPSSRLIEGVRLAGCILKPAASPQTNRPSEFVPELVSSFERASISRYRAVHDAQSLLKPVCFTDEVLIDREEYTQLLGQHNLICLGAGDTNGITKWILDYYGNLLPVQFDYPSSSQVLRFASDTGALKVLLRETDPSTGEIIGYQGGPKSFAALTFMLPNPANHQKVCLVIAGLVALGTQAATLAIAEWWRGIKEDVGVENNWLRVVEATEAGADAYRPGSFRFLL